MAQAGSSITCRNCGATNAAGEQFCTNCGFELTGAPPSSGSFQASGPVGGTGGRRMTGALGSGIEVGGRYKIIRLVGKGGFGAVYEASDERFQSRRKVAIKEMSDGALSPKERAQAIQDFRQEADLLVSLNHPNLPNVSDFFEEGNKAYLVMEYIEGKSLEKIQDEQAGPLDEKLVMDWALQLCDVLAYLHSRSQPIIFRDMKPSNVMLTSDDTIKLIDFGIARIFKSSASKDTTLLGSQGYAPLEQYGRGQSDARSDIYALGATLFDLLTKTLPMDAPSRRINPSLFETPREIVPSISPSVERIVLKAMEQEPKDRYQTAAEMYQDILASGNTAGLATPRHLNTGSRPASSGTPVKPAPTPRNPVPSPPPGGNRAPVQRQQPAPVNLRAASQAAPPQVRPVPPYPTPTQHPGPNTVSRRNLLIGGVGVVGAIILGGGFLVSQRSTKTGPGSTTQPTAPVGAGGTIQLNFLFSTEKKDWVNAAITTFNQSGQTLDGKTIQIMPDSSGSVDSWQKILSGSQKPTIWSPASDLELSRLNNAWQQQHSGKEVVPTSGTLLPQSLVSSPLVFAIWADRAAVFKKKYQKVDWPGLHEAVLSKNGWADLGGSPDWSLVKFCHTRPDTSNSGLLTITLIAYSYFKSLRGLTVAQVQDPKFLAYLSDFEGAVQTFGRSSGTFLENVVIPQGPASCDISTTYENLVLQDQQKAQDRQKQQLQLFYPGENILSNHPFAVLQGDWVSNEQQQAALKFRDFLLSEGQQRQALTYGFRPGNANVALDDSVRGNLFKTVGAQLNISPTISPQAQAPSGNVIEELLKQWSQRFGTAATSTAG